MCEFDRQKSKKPAKERVESPTPTRRQSQVRRNRASNNSRDNTNTELSNTRRVSPRTASPQVVISRASGVATQRKQEKQDKIEVKDDVTEAVEALISFQYLHPRVFLKVVKLYTYLNSYLEILYLQYGLGSSKGEGCKVLFARRNITYQFHLRRSVKLSFVLITYTFTLNAHVKTSAARRIGLSSIFSDFVEVVVITNSNFATTPLLVYIFLVCDITCISLVTLGFRGN